jgi:hypothetical protein
VLAETEGTAATQRAGAVTVHFGSRITTAPAKYSFKNKQKTASISDFLGFLDSKKLLQVLKGEEWSRNISLAHREKSSSFRDAES